MRIRDYDVGYYVADFDTQSPFTVIYPTFYRTSVVAINPVPGSKSIHVSFMCLNGNDRRVVCMPSYYFIR